MAELLAPGLDVVRPSSADRDPEVRSMAAALVGDASVEWTADLDLLLAAEAAEPHALARACPAEAAVTLALRAPAARLPGRVKQWLHDPEAAVRFRVARIARTAPAAEYARLALLADGAHDADPGAMETVWPAVVRARAPGHATGVGRTEPADQQTVPYGCSVRPARRS
ncbi:hypothetical protein ABT075_22815 [Streptomyces sp. NPDC002677]|uniref:hypothetical protein n=1 Tax=Streptomyces sp. NPDC002677 TaxID=3154774 RepID=UPI0033312207